MTTSESLKKKNAAKALKATWLFCKICVTGGVISFDKIVLLPNAKNGSDHRVA